MYSFEIFGARHTVESIFNNSPNSNNHGPACVVPKIYTSLSQQRLLQTTYHPFITINSSLFSFAGIKATLAITILYEKIKSC